MASYNMVSEFSNEADPTQYEYSMPYLTILTVLIKVALPALNKINYLNS